MNDKELSHSFYKLFELVAEGPLVAQEVAEYAATRCRHLQAVLAKSPSQFEACLIVERDNVALAMATQAMRASQLLDDRIKALIYGAMRIAVDALV